MRRSWTIFGLTIAGLGFGPGAFAQAPPAAPPMQQQAHPCAQDAERLCHGVPMGGGAQMQCLKAHKQQLSPACKVKVLEAAEQHEKQKMGQPQKTPNQAPVPPSQPMPQPQGMPPGQMPP